MARISGIDIPREKRVIASLQYIHGVGLKRSEDICNDLKICLLYTSDAADE